jgi:hypothetical protein
MFDLSYGDKCKKKKGTKAWMCFFSSIKIFNSSKFVCIDLIINEVVICYTL